MYRVTKPRTREITAWFPKLNSSMGMVSAIPYWFGRRVGVIKLQY